ncbi:hypothetical protein [Aminicella lysinilytica]|uniref:aspartate-alanine antiporter-like transporter n=1 Tax=Aminicella lysinilytica TaxID=433323 RepID=UPI0026EABA3C|nr:hypothetical protein [Aminicella lysinilytica]
MSFIQFDFWSLLLNPFILMFVTIALGLLFGKIKFGKFSFGASGALFVGLVIGWAVYKYADQVYKAGDDGSAVYKVATNIFVNNNGNVVSDYFFSASLVFFISALGLLAAKDLGVVIKKYGAKFVVLGILITFVGAGVTYGATFIVKGSNAYAVAGIYTGALTSSPGLGAALESSESHANEVAADYSNLKESEKVAAIKMINLGDKYKLSTKNVPAKINKGQQNEYVKNAVAQVGMGHAVSYPFGVIVVILAMNFFNMVFKFDVAEEKRQYYIEMEKASQNLKVRQVKQVPFNIMGYSIVCVAGYLLGSINIYMGPLGYVNLGATGGVLIASLLLGYIGDIGPLHFRMDPKILSEIRELGLVFFLAIVGLNYGYGAINACISSVSGLIVAVLGFVIGAIAILVGFIVGRYVFKINWVMLSGALCGGMTSTPGLGAATEALGCDEPGAGYGATYPFALFGMILFTILTFKLPMV